MREGGEEGEKERVREGEGGKVAKHYLSFLKFLYRFPSATATCTFLSLRGTEES